MAHTAEHIAAQVRARRAALATKRPMWRKRLPRALPPNAIALEYYKAIRAILARARALVAERVLPVLPALVAEAAAARGDARLDREDVNRLIDAISETYFGDLRSPELVHLAQRFAERTADFQREQLSRQVRAAFGVDVLADARIAPRVADFVTENVALIKTVPNYYFDQIESTITRGVRQGLRHEVIARELNERAGAAENRAKVIARDQVLTLYANVNRARQEALGVKRYIWRTSSDERVRDEHAEREGQTFAYADPPEDGAPGEAILCRCYAEPDFSDVIAGL